MTRGDIRTVAVSAHVMAQGPLVMISGTGQPVTGHVRVGDAATALVAGALVPSCRAAGPEGQ